MTLSIRSGSLITVGALLGTGKQGEIYAIPARPGAVLKKYKPSALAEDPTLESRLTVMTAHPPAQWREPASGHITLTWPTEIVAENGRFTGFLMPAVDMDTTVDLHQVTNPTERPRATGRTAWVSGFTWQYLMRTAVNLAQAADALHQGGVVAGDFNDSNVRVTHEARVTLLDCDSMQVTDPATGQRFFCPVGRGEFTPPELLNADWKTTYRHPSSDLFALAVHVYQLLLEGEHPFRGIWSGTGEKPHEPQLARLGIWSHQKDAPLSPRPAAIPIDTLLPPDIVALFRRAFEDGATNPTSRPAALEWHQALTALERTLTVCTVNPAHWYPASCSVCPWCCHGRPNRQRPLPALRAPAIAPRPMSAPRAPSAASRRVTSVGSTTRTAVAAPAPVQPVSLMAPARSAARPILPAQPLATRGQSSRGRVIVAISCILALVTGTVTAGIVLTRKTVTLPVATFTSGAGVQAVAFSPDGKTLATGDDSGTVYLWDVATGKSIATLTEPGGQEVQAMAFSPDGKTLATGDTGGDTYLWSVPSGRMIATLADRKAGDQGIMSIAFGPRGTLLATGDFAGHTYLWNPATGHEVTQLNYPANSNGGVSSVAFSLDGTRLASGDEDNGFTYLWGVTTGRAVTTFVDPLGPNADVTAVAFSPDGKTAASADAEGMVYLWNPAYGVVITSLTDPARMREQSLAFSPNGKMIAASDPLGQVYLWNPGTGHKMVVFTDPAPGEEGAQALAFSPNGKLLATGDENGKTYLWSISPATTK